MIVWISYYLLGYILTSSSLFIKRKKLFIVSFIIFLFLSNMKIRLDNNKERLLLFLSKYLFEVYLVYGAVMDSI